MTITTTFCSTLAEYQQLVDSIALATTGATSAADPLVCAGGKLYPSVFSVQDSIDGAGVETSGCDADAHILANKIAGASGEFSANYSKLLSLIFSISGDSGLAVRHLTMCFSLVPAAADRHLAYKVVAPFYWIEPTGVLQTHDECFPAIKAGFGPITKPGHTIVLPMFEDVSTVDLGGGLAGVSCTWRSARTAGLLIHLNDHRLDSLANFILRRADVERFVFVGGGSQGVMERMKANSDLASYLWGRGQSCLPAPGELLYTGVALSMVVKLGVFNDTLFTYNNTHTPNAAEMRSGTVAVSCTRAVPMSAAAVSLFSKHINRSRSAAAAALSNARYRPGGMNPADSLFRLL
ncbi:hypothetical protein K450DRAFT_297773 [Umbelopsis ramanniana AG]|uniref:Uncharacterized protein n=1 Tax=Umbelopsis ramanniana AG TaxID=1314678 RepID=A0AAD5EHJ5_UMBRA|nr:uncharacterized protein K450DRAFT_297773 [Umbelopsis ramanniana AG]KAI8582400.1 hypothetical protein K450DRAFT_297773 [Umbelopsis ramanniana AG]